MSSAAAVGTVVREGDWVQCYLCERWFRSVLAHLPSHGWDHLSYRRAFGLERGESLEGAATRQRRAKAFRVRRAVDPVVRAGCEQGLEMARSGALTKAAAEAARGRRQPEQRRRKTLRTLAAISPEARAEGRRRQIAEQLSSTAAQAAARLGFADVGALVRDRVAGGASLAAISREAGLHKDWMCRNLATVDSEAARFVRDRAAESARARRGLVKTPYAAKRIQRDERAAAVAARFGFSDIGAYFGDRRAAGMSWKRIAVESGQPESWIRRRAGLSN
jgi:hypothetical protein